MNIPNDISTHHLQEQLTAEQREILRLQQALSQEQAARKQLTFELANAGQGNEQMQQMQARMIDLEQRHQQSLNAPIVNFRLSSLLCKNLSCNLELSTRYRLMC